MAGTTEAANLIASPKQASNKLLESALYYATVLGWRIFPLMPKTKKPRSGSRGVYDASNDPEQIRRWWAENPNYNIGLACGKASGVIVLDGDGEQEAEDLKK